MSGRNNGVGTGTEATAIGARLQLCPGEVRVLALYRGDSYRSEITVVSGRSKGVGTGIEDSYRSEITVVSGGNKGVGTV